MVAAPAVPVPAAVVGDNDVVINILSDEEDPREVQPMQEAQFDHY